MIEQAKTSRIEFNPEAFAGLVDIVESFRHVSLWSTLGWYDFIVRSRRTTLGPLWQTVIVGVWVLGLWAVFGRILEHNDPSYPAYLASGIVLWNFLSTTLSGSTQVFIKNAKLIFSVNNPLYTYVLRHVFDIVTRFVFQSFVFVAVVPFSHLQYFPTMLLAVPGLLLVFFTSLWLVPLMGILGARFRDLSPALSAAMRFLFFTTPVFWHADGLGERAYLAQFNPFTHFLAIVRGPLLGTPPPPDSWIVVGAISAAGTVLTLFIYNRFRRQIVFWL